MTQLYCRSIALDLEVDLDHVWSNLDADEGQFLFIRNGIGVTSYGEATRASSEEIGRVLESVNTAEGSRAPIAVGALPFEPDLPGTFVIPAVCIIRTHTRTDLVVVGDSAATSVEALDKLRSNLSRSVIAVVPRSANFSVGPITPESTYLAAVGAARDAVRSGEITKAVIARDIRVSASEPIDLTAVMMRLKSSFGSSYRYRFGNLIGASPELLIEVEGDTVRSNPLAGTTSRTGDPSTDQQLAAALLASEKNQIEHRVVVDMVHDTLLPFCSYLDWEPEPSVVPVANVQHLGTRVEGRLGASAHIVDLARLLCPTPALGGYPRDTAVNLIRLVEGMDRGLYGGAIGWCDATGDGVFAVTIRCAEFQPDRREARLFAGGGIVADSDPRAELAETQAKFQAMLSAIIRP